MQTYPEPAMNARSWFYGSALMSEAFQEGWSYRKIPKARVINILDFTVRAGHPDILQPIGLTYRKGTSECATDAFRIYNIELPKFRALKPTLDTVKDDALLRWLYLLDKGYNDEHELEVLSSMTEGMKAFARRYQITLNDPDLRRMYELEMSAKREKASMIENAEIDGWNRGLNEGRNEGRYEVIGGMLKKRDSGGDDLQMRERAACGDRRDHRQSQSREPRVAAGRYIARRFVANAENHTDMESAAPQRG